MNVLITSAGRRTSLVRPFCEAVHSRGGQVHTGDMDGLAPALFLADAHVRLPQVLSDEYIPFLLDYADKHHIALIVPSIDTELPTLAKHRKLFEERGCTALLSSPELVATSCDKWATKHVFGDLGIGVPASWLPPIDDLDPLPDKLFIKPRNGSASVHAHRANKDNLLKLLSFVPNPIIQERLEGREITIDALLDLDGTPIHYVPRVRGRTVGGESIQGWTIAEPRFNAWLEVLLAAVGKLGGVGPQTLQAFITPDNGFVFSEINPRFGGGFPLGFAAGAHYPEWILQMVEGKTVEPRLGQYTADLHMSRYYVEIITEAPKW